jgi:hypothetical protein
MIICLSFWLYVILDNETSVLEWSFQTFDMVDI